MDALFQDYPQIRLFFVYFVNILYLSFYILNVIYGNFLEINRIIIAFSIFIILELIIYFRHRNQEQQWKATLKLHAFLLYCLIVVITPLFATTYFQTHQYMLKLPLYVIQNIYFANILLIIEIGYTTTNLLLLQILTNNAKNYLRVYLMVGVGLLFEKIFYDDNNSFQIFTVAILIFLSLSMLKIVFENESLKKIIRNAYNSQ